MSDHTDNTFDPAIASVVVIFEKQLDDLDFSFGKMEG